MNKIQMKTPLVEMDGDEMTRILWKMIKDELLLPFVDLKTEYYDLGLPEREKTKDKVYVMVFLGEGLPEDAQEKAETIIRQKAPNCEIAVMAGGQPLYPYLISVE